MDLDRVFSVILIAFRGVNTQENLGAIGAVLTKIVDLIMQITRDQRELARSRERTFVKMADLDQNFHVSHDEFFICAINSSWIDLKTPSDCCFNMM